jgi:hypothetical protein
MSYYGYEYFCGANVIIEIERFPILQAAGLSVSISESKRPIYGYSSRFFDAVARGQVIVEGSLLVNYVHQDYLFRAMEAGKNGGRTLPPISSSDSSIGDIAGNEIETDKLTEFIMKNYSQAYQLTGALKDKYWSVPDSSVSASPFDASARNPHDDYRAGGILVTFGERSDETGYLGDTGFYLSDVYFTGRGTRIQIDETVILEEYNFFARNMYPLKQKQQAIEEEVDGESTTTVSRVP